MIDEQSFSDSRRGMNLDAGDAPIQVGDQSRENRNVCPVECMSDSMKLPGVKARVTQHDFEGRSRRGIAIEHSLDISTNAR